MSFVQGLQLLWAKVLAGILPKPFSLLPPPPCRRVWQYVSVRFELNVAIYRDSGKGQRAGEGEDLSTVESKAVAQPWRGAGSRFLSCSALPPEVLKLLWKQGDSVSPLPGDYISPLHGLGACQC